MSGHFEAGEYRSGFVAVFGRPNVGKSTLVNALVGHKVSIVSDHPQTTRRRISGVLRGVGWQAVLLDLPGFQRPFDKLTTRMQGAVDETLAEVDGALVVLNAAEGLGAGDRYIINRVAAAELPAIYVINKIDLVADGDVARLREQTAELTEPGGAAGLTGDAAAEPAGDGVAGPTGDERVAAVSATLGHGLDGLRERLAAMLPPGPQYFPEDEFSDQPLEALIAELVREQALLRTREEVPHAIGVEVVELVERTDRPLLEVQALLIVETESQKAICVGKGGRVIKAIGSAARLEIERLLGVQVFLDLRIKVRKHWRRDDRYVDRLL